LAGLQAAQLPGEPVREFGATGGMPSGLIVNRKSYKSSYTVQNPVDYAAHGLISSPIAFPLNPLLTLLLEAFAEFMALPNLLLAGSENHQRIAGSA
jgi:hypothetical protein